MSGPVTPAGQAAGRLAGAATGVWTRPALAAALFTVAVAANAALLFAVQPMASKLALPLLGGTPSVWNTCMMVFQALLLGGYLYAHVLTARLAPRAQAVVHLALFGLALLALPVAAPRAAPPAGASPSLWLAGSLLASVGAPFFVLSAGAPLLQRWFAASGHPSGGNPYFLYAASNAGSMVALLGYPLVVEPRLGLAAQGAWWGTAYAALGALLVGCALVTTVGAAGGAGRAAVPAAGQADAEARVTARPSARARLAWVALAFVPSTLLLGVTRYVTTDVAPVPLLWVVPLALYLLTFVLAFAERARVPDDLVDPANAALLALLAVLVALGANKPLGAIAAAHLVAFFVASLACHQTLAARRPGVAHLTEFYLWISVGGLLGGVFNALVAPTVFDTLAEYPLAVVLAAGARALAAPTDDVPAPRARPGRAPALFRRLAEDADDAPPSRAWWATVHVLAPLAAGGFMYMAGARLSIVPKGVEVAFASALGGLAAMLAISLRRWRLAFAAAVAAMLVGGIAGRDTRSAGVLARARSFFGTYTVKASGPYHYLQHGTTLHGAQAHGDSAWRLRPLTYYHARGPLGVLFDSAPRLRAGAPPRRVAVVGLGTGTVACWGRRGERWTFYEIDPAIERIARDRRYFTYLRDCPPAAAVTIGDARVRLAEAPDGAYDLVLLDAFSSDAIPVHLITREALALYLSKLAPDGLVAFHVSNRYLDLVPVLAELARDARVAGAVGNDVSGAAHRSPMFSSSSWVVLARQAAAVAPLARADGWRPLPPRADVRLWTDDYTDVLSVVKLR